MLRRVAGEGLGRNCVHAEVSSQALDLAIAQRASKHYGNLTRRDLLDLGLSDGGIAYRTRIGRLHRVYRGVYAVGRRALTPLERASAAVLACGPGAALSHGIEKSARSTHPWFYRARSGLACIIGRAEHASGDDLLCSIPRSGCSEARVARRGFSLLGGLATRRAGTCGASTAGGWRWLRGRGGRRVVFSDCGGEIIEERVDRAQLARTGAGEQLSLDGGQGAEELPAASAGQLGDLHQDATAIVRVG